MGGGGLAGASPWAFEGELITSGEPGASIAETLTFVEAPRV